MGTNTDPYQRAEGRYRLMPDIISALADSGTPFSILTKGTVLSRDLPVLAAAADLGPGRASGCRWPCSIRAAGDPGAGHPEPAGPAGTGPADPGGRAAVRGVHRAAAAVPDRHRRADHRRWWPSWPRPA